MSQPQLDPIGAEAVARSQVSPAPARHRKHRMGRILFKVAVMAVIFLAGGVSGWLYGVRFAVTTAVEQKANMRDIPDRAIPHLAKDLSLTAEQLPEFERIFRKYHEEMTRVEADRAGQVHEYFYEMGRDILPLLNPDQQAEFRKIHHKICAYILGPIPQLSGQTERPHDPCDDL